VRRLLAAAALAALLGACKSGQPVVTPLIGTPPNPPVQPVVIPPTANYLFVGSEAVASADQDEAAFFKIYIDNREAGQTDIAPKSKEKKWGAVLPVGNHLFRFQAWVLPTPGEWTPMASGWQPPERFIRVEPGLKTVTTLKLYDGGRRHSLQIERQPLTAPQ
jgi:hypothetical protein